jgi:hypothetical protein
LQRQLGLVFRHRFGGDGGNRGPIPSQAHQRGPEQSSLERVTRGYRLSDDRIGGRFGAFLDQLVPLRVERFRLVRDERR